MTEQAKPGIPPLDESKGRNKLIPAAIIVVVCMGLLYFVNAPDPDAKTKSADRGIDEFRVQAPPPPPAPAPLSEQGEQAQLAPASEMTREQLMQQEQNQQMLAIAAAERQQQDDWNRKMAEEQIRSGQEAAEQARQARQKRMRASMRIARPEGESRVQVAATASPESAGNMQPAEQQFAFAQPASRQSAGYAYEQPQRPHIQTGKVISGVLETGLNSDFPGPVRAVVSEDVWDAQGERIAIPKGSLLIGEQRGTATQGQSRAYVIWHELQMPNGYVLPIASAASDEQGMPAIGGKVNNHFLKRFGAAILISMIDAAVEAESDNATVTVGPAGRSTLGTTLERTSQIPPTITVKRGTRFSILVQRTLML